ncbi:hypothetical protein OAK24_02540 [Flavobacteriales bacterium]|nr:hypothetical protein [Flavobacteriales bacterium]
MKRIIIYQLIFISIITLIVLALSSCVATSNQCAAYAMVSIR